MSILKQDKIPYGLVLLFGTLAWSLTHIVDGLTSSPFLEYSVETTKQNNDYVVKYIITNLTKDKNIEQIDFFVKPEGDEDSLIISAYSIIIPPLKITDGDYEEWTGSHYKYHLSNFQPNCKIIFKIKINKDETLPLRFSSKTPVLLSDANTSTWFVKNELIILVILTVTISFLIIISLFRTNGKNDN